MARSSSQSPAPAGASPRRTLIPMSHHTPGLKATELYHTSGSIGAVLYLARDAAVPGVVRVAGCVAIAFITIGYALCRTILKRPCASGLSLLAIYRITELPPARTPAPTPP